MAKNLHMSENCCTFAAELENAAANRGEPHQPHSGQPSEEKNHININING